MSGPLSATFSLLSHTSSYATNCLQFALSKKKFIKNQFRICITNKNFHHYLTLAVIILEQKLTVGNCQVAQNAITPTSRKINDADNFC